MDSKGIRGEFRVRISGSIIVSILDVGTPESDTAIVQALRELVKVDNANKPFFDDRLLYQPWTR